MCEVMGEQVSAAWNCFDFLDMYRQLGAEISTPPPRPAAPAPEPAPVYSPLPASRRPHAAHMIDDGITNCGSFKRPDPDRSRWR